jgi:UDP:flavonoid glycosyltransferase YjiC (YdhE family)
VRIVIASTPAAGHVNPVAAIGRILISEGHEVVGVSGKAFGKHFEDIGAGFRPLPAGTDPDFQNIASFVPELKSLPEGTPRLVRSRIILERAFIDTMPLQHEALQQILRDGHVDAIVGDNAFLGVLPMLLGPRAKRPPVILCGTSILIWQRADGAPNFAGLPPMTTAAQRRQYATIARQRDSALEQPNVRRANEHLKAMGLRPLPRKVFESPVELADAYLQLSVPGFEFPRVLPDSVRFIGTLPVVSNQAPLPPWAPELDGRRKVVLVSQGTVANHDFGLLVAPTLAALADEPDLLVVVTAGGRPVEAIPGPIPANARLASYLPYEWLLPKVDVCVTNGGYGGVNQALSFGIPLVTAGLTEDKADVNVRIAWFGVGINLATNTPAPATLRNAVRTVLDTQDYRLRAARMAGEFAAIDTRAEILRIVRQVTSNGADGSPRGAAVAGRQGQRAGHCHLG